VIGVVIVLVFGTRGVVWLTQRIWPAGPEEERIHRGVEEARRRIDRFRRY
jgi:hypothetical protein